MISRFARWYDAHPVAGDACLAGLLLVAFVVPSDLSAPTDALVDLTFSVALVACVPFRRRAPVAVFVVVATICLVQLALLDHVVAGDVVALIALYTVVAYGPRARLGTVATACTAIGALLGAIRWHPSDVSLLQVAATMVVSVLLAATIDVTLYRIAQEALTNVLKHARAVSRVDVIVRYGDGAVELRVHDDGHGPQTTGDGRGQGLVGMRERVDLHDGTLFTGPGANGGFVVEAVIPTAERIATPA